MKILMINVVCGVKSTGRICTDLADILLEQGHEIKIVYGRENVPDKYQKIAIRVGDSLDVYMHAMKNLVFDSCGFESEKYTIKLIKQIKAFNPDVIHLHNLHGYYINVEILFNYLKVCGKRIIWTLHDCWAFTGHCSFFAAVNCQQWKLHCTYCIQKKEYPRALFISNAFKNYEKKKRLFTGIPNLIIVTPSHWLADQVKESYLKGYPVVTIANGIDLTQFKFTDSDFRKRHHLEDKKIVLGVATSWGQRKGLEGFRELSKALGPQYKVVLIGLSKKQMKDIEEDIVKIERTNSVRALAAVYSAADVFLNLSREETMGLTTVEAMACGTPVLVSNFTAVPEVVTKQGGIILGDLKMETIIKQIEIIINSNFSDVRSNAYKYEKYQQYEKYIKLYQGLERWES